MNDIADNAKPTARKHFRALPAKASARKCRVGGGQAATSKPRLPRATLAAMRETDDIIAHPEKYPGMTFAEYVAWAHSL